MVDALTIAWRMNIKQCGNRCKPPRRGQSFQMAANTLIKAKKKAEAMKFASAFVIYFRSNVTAYAPKTCSQGMAAAFSGVSSCFSYTCCCSAGMAGMDLPSVLTPWASVSANFHWNLQLQYSLFCSIFSAGTKSSPKKQPSLSFSAGQPPIVPRPVYVISRKELRKVVEVPFFS